MKAIMYTGQMNILRKYYFAKLYWTFLWLYNLTDSRIQLDVLAFIEKL